MGNGISVNPLSMQSTVPGNKTGRHLRGRAIAGAVLRTRPLCPYPQYAEYTGSGSTDDAANFACR
jgi:feruloyl esterase